jgi:hypothetical protein
MLLVHVLVGGDGACLPRSLAGRDGGRSGDRGMYAASVILSTVLFRAAPSLPGPGWDVPLGELAALRRDRGKWRSFGIASLSAAIR